MDFAHPAGFFCPSQKNFKNCEKALDKMAKNR